MPSRRRLAWLPLLLLMLALLLAPSSASAAGGPGHWAAVPAQRLRDALGWTPPADLDAPIPVLEWNRLVARVAGENPGDADPAVHPRQYWVWAYSGGMARGKMTVAREDAIGGLMKLTSYLYQEKSFTADPSALKSFTDGPLVDDGQQVLVAGAVRLGLVTGYPEGLLSPKRPLTYAEGVTLLARLMEKYGPTHPLPKLPPMEPSPFPQPRSFASGTGVRFAADRVIHAGWPVGTVGTAWWVINGAAWSTTLPQVGAAPKGYLWVAVDAEIYNWDLPTMSVAPGDLRFTLETDGSVYEVDAGASSALGSPFGKETVTLQQWESLRGFLVFAVPAGTKSVWMRCDSKLGLAPGKPGWNGGSRTPLGDLPAQP